MKQYVIDQLREEEQKKIKAYLDARYPLGGMADLYWIPLTPEILTEVQWEHRTCQPFYFALELHPDRLACEFLIRTRERVRCACMGYATETQRNWLIRFVDAIFETLEIQT